MARKIFITGTGTDVGKTFVSALIVKKMIESAVLEKRNNCYCVITVDRG